MFGGSRRHRPPVQPLTKETANPNAATAAASAFMRREASTSLSSAAAAAALRARPTTPTNVAEVQSKRAARRSPSVSSIGSRDRGRSSLQRSPSVGSMSERSFRSPSPGRGPAPQHRNVPPVPKLPADGHLIAATKAAGAGAGAGRKATALQTQPFRTASQKMKDGQSDSWFGAAKARDPTNVRKSDIVLQTSFDPHEARPGSISPSINFSYPRARSASIDSHNTPSPIADNTMVYDPNSRRMVPRVDLLERQNTIREASEKPVKKKKKAQEVSRSGSHLAKGTVGRTKAPILEASNTGSLNEAPRPKQHTEPEPEPELVEDVAQIAPHSIETAHQPSEAPIDSGTALESRITQTRMLETNASAYVPEAVESSTNPAAVAEPSVIHREAAPINDEDYESSEDEMNDAAHMTKAPLASNYITTGAEVLPRSLHTEDKLEEDKGLVDEKPSTVTTRQPNSIRRDRVHSESPVRTAHFASATDQLVVRHEPPSRSLSPRKSALKHRSPSRGASPSDDSSEASGSAHIRDEASLGRKKSVRVSFDQNTVVVGEAAAPTGETDSPVVPSPQAYSKKPWHAIVGRQNRKDHASLDEDETMSPRPALPLFGSVREKKVKEPEERPLVRPVERTWSPSPVSPAPRQSSPFNSPTAKSPTDLANDSSSSTDQRLKHEANTSKYREPLPPVVTSVEGSGYISSSASSSDNEDEIEPTEHAPVTTQPSIIPSNVENAAMESEAIHTTPQPRAASDDIAAPVDSPRVSTEPNTTGHPVTERVVPDISISYPSPSVHGTPQSAATPRQEYFDVPGGFPEEDESDHATVDDSHSPIVTSNTTSEITPSTTSTNSRVQENAFNTTAPAIDTQVPTASTDTNEKLPAPASPMEDIEEEEEVTDGDSIYSDAYEDLSDVDGDGFMSLDAVLTAPVVKKNHEKPNKTKVDQDISRAAILSIQNQPPLEGPHQLPDDWENAKAYWRSLSTEKRRQLEVEAMHDAEDETETTPQPKPKKKVHQKATNGGTTEVSSREQQNGHTRSYQIQPGTKWPNNESPEAHVKSQAKGDRGGGMKLRKSMRQQEAVSNGSPIHQGTMRKSLRSGGSNTSMSTGSPSKQTSRPLSHQPQPTTDLVGGHKRILSADSKPSKSDPFTGPTIKGSLGRRGSDASESSFTRSRATLGEGFGFKKTMRSSMYEPITAKPATDHMKGSSRFSLRSLSPSGSAFRRGSMTASPPATGGRMRSSLRADSNEGSGSRMRIPTFSKATGKKARSKLDSGRFADSSDEEDGRAVFSSRFADSSDEDDAPRPQSKGQGLPKSLRNRSSASAAAATVGAPVNSRQEVESPDLPDSDDEVVQPKRPVTNGVTNGVVNGKTNTTLHRSGSGRGHMVGPHQAGATETDVTPPRPTQSRRGSFMSAILRRKKGPAGKISKGTGESAARRDTPLERSTEELSMIRTGSNGKPRLQKRAPSWPFPDEPALGTTASATSTALPSKDRPSTAGGPAQSSKKAEYLRRRSASYNGPAAASALEDDEAVALPETQMETQIETPKKKKFGTLRKMFRLHD